MQHMHIFKQHSCMWNDLQSTLCNKIALLLHIQVCGVGISPQTNRDRQHHTWKQQLSLLWNRRKGKPSFVGCQWVWQRLRSIWEIKSASLSLDRRGFKNAAHWSGGNMLTAHKKGVLVYQLKPPSSRDFLLPLNSSHVILPPSFPTHNGRLW